MTVWVARIGDQIEVGRTEAAARAAIEYDREELGLVGETIVEECFVIEHEDEVG